MLNNSLNYQQCIFTWYPLSKYIKDKLHEQLLLDFNIGEDKIGFEYFFPVASSCKTNPRPTKCLPFAPSSESASLLTLSISLKSLNVFTCDGTFGGLLLFHKQKVELPFAN